MEEEPEEELKSSVPSESDLESTPSEPSSDVSDGASSEPASEGADVSSDSSLSQPELSSSPMAVKVGLEESSAPVSSSSQLEETESQLPSVSSQPEESDEPSSSQIEEELESSEPSSSSEVEEGPESEGEVSLEPTESTYGYNVKESIIINRVQESYRYDFLLNFNGLTPVLQENGSVDLVNEAKEVIYQIPAPYMVDAKQDVSYDAHYELTHTTEGYVLTVEADKKWIDAENRTFPVMIDPTW